ncbi:DNA repair protein RecN [Alkalilimnicola ehrlichii MLHE-1]|uniref:DNA repair protein RecN n=1 Tax=Alkalilimnicola ehrlichii (strain ATCC BAA-1101 / DSM 17681 / MLHE-1) TaxID=187272 RepID=Q0A7D9_ALKEH|nr:DNA repair protein RecN [Alkalilimnicola ehrlichii]ABI57248.1 DNA replication and repair protein RecN [Alkalilimnicola ehrlichii MLHE-1]
MLSHIDIRDFAIVDQLELDFGAGMNVLTGETGAGKSILLDALGLCLGDRADSGTVRPGAKRADLSVSFRLAPDSPVHDWLAEHDLDEDGDCILRRTIQESGRTRGYINGRPAPLNLLKALGEQLVDIHGQHAHQLLLRRHVQRRILDEHADEGGALERVRSLHQQLRAVDEELRALEGDRESHEDRLALLRYQVDELAALELTVEGIEALEQEQKRLANAGALIQMAQQILDPLYDDEQSAQAALGRASRELDGHAGLDPALDEARELFGNALVQLEEGCDALRRFADNLELDPERLAWAEERLGQLSDLARKHRCRPEALPERLEALQAELAELEGAGERVQALREQRAALHRDYREAAATLSEQRQAHARALEQRVAGLLEELSMGGAELQIQVAFDAEAEPTPHGLDQVEFLVRTNPGQAFGPLAKVASGGELSRLGLALQVASTKGTGAPTLTLVFDEADSGIGGAVAEVVGRLLASLGQRYQVLCITHLPQVAAQAGCHFQVSKHSERDRTRTRVTPLTGEQRIQEVARMLGGVEISDNTLASAREMLERGAGRRRETA